MALVLVLVLVRLSSTPFPCLPSLSPRVSCPAKQRRSLTFTASLPPPGSIPPPPPKEDEAPKPDLHAQADNAADHKSVPAPIIKTISPRDPAKDRTLPQTDNEKEANQPISSNPNVSAKDVKQQAEAPPAPPGKAGVTAAPAPTPAIVPANLAANTPVAAPTPVDKPVAPAAPVQNPAAVAQAQNVPAASAEPPQTPTKTAAAAVAGTPGSIASTPATTPQKGAQTTDDKIRKRKSSFFAKVCSSRLHCDPG